MNFSWKPPFIPSLLKDAEDRYSPTKMDKLRRWWRYTVLRKRAIPIVIWPPDYETRKKQALYKAYKLSDAERKEAWRQASERLTLDKDWPSWQWLRWGYLRYLRTRISHLFWVVRYYQHAIKCKAVGLECFLYLGKLNTPQSEITESWTKDKQIPLEFTFHPEALDSIIGPIGGRGITYKKSEMDE